MAEPGTVGGIGNRVIDQLANTPNRAVHAGEHPDETVALRAIETAGLLVQEAVPLPRPDDIQRLARSKSPAKHVVGRWAPGGVVTEGAVRTAPPAGGS